MIFLENHKVLEIKKKFLPMMYFVIKEFFSFTCKETNGMVENIIAPIPEIKGTLIASFINLK